MAQELADRLKAHKGINFKNTHFLVQTLDFCFFKSRIVHPSTQLTVRPYKVQKLQLLHYHDRVGVQLFVKIKGHEYSLGYIDFHSVTKPQPGKNRGGGKPFLSFKLSNAGNASNKKKRTVP